MRGLLSDVKHTAVFLAFFLTVALTGVSLPAFLLDLMISCQTVQEGTQCARKHLRRTCKYLGDILSLVMAWHTYKVVVRAGLYGLLVPAACLAEAFPTRSLDTLVRFIFGLLVWLGLLAGAIYTSIHALSVGQSPSIQVVHMMDTGSWEVPQPAAANEGFLGFCSAVTAVLLLAALSVSRRKEYASPCISAVTSSELTWSHILAVLTAPFEATQLSAVVLYFFWSSSPAQTLASVSSATLSSGPPPQLTGVPLKVSGYDQDVFASGLFSWGLFHHNTYLGYHGSVTVAAFAILVWAVVVALPLATLSSNASRRIAKMSAITGSPFYDFVAVLVSRLFAVWMMATLMRPSSCLTMVDFSYTGALDPGTSSAVNGTVVDLSYVMSTDLTQRCGGGRGNTHNWFAAASLSLLVYFMITSSILHADSAKLLVAPSDSDGHRDTIHSVRFAPLYALLMRLGQFLICALCAGLFPPSHTNPNVALGLVVAVSTLMMLLPATFEHGVVCSFRPVTPLRCAGAAWVVWAAVLCLFRRNAAGAASASLATQAHWAGAEALFIGWGIIALLGLLCSLFVYRRTAEQWRQGLESSRLANTMEKVIQSIELMNDEEALSHSSADSAIAWKTLTKEAVEKANSPVQLASILLSLEEIIQADRLSRQFLQKRSKWINDLKSLTGDFFVVGEEEGENLSRGNDEAFTIVSEAADSLLASTRPRPVAVSLSRSLLSTLLSRRLPPEVSWEIFSYCVNVLPYKDILMPILTEQAYPASRYSTDRLPSLHLLESIGRTLRGKRPELEMVGM